MCSWNSYQKNESLLRYLSSSCLASPMVSSLAPSRQPNLTVFMPCIVSVDLKSRASCAAKMRLLLSDMALPVRNCRLNVNGVVIFHINNLCITQDVQMSKLEGN